jgi:hypothetical protein
MKMAVCNFYQSVEAGGVDQTQKMETNEIGQINLVIDLKCLLLIYIKEMQKGLLLILITDFYLNTK